MVEMDEQERRIRRRIFWTALIVRLLYMTLAHTYRVRPGLDHFEFGWEAGRIARALVTGYGYADPFNAHTGPTSWLPPAYPLLMAGVFKVFGLYSGMSAWVLLALNCVMSASTAVAVREVAQRTVGKRAALWAGWMWALYPAAMQYTVRWLWEMTMTTWIFTWIMVLMLRMRTDGEGQSWRRWMAFGLMWGALVLSSPTPGILLPVFGVWLLAAPKFEPKRLAKAALAGVMFVAAILPWTARNWSVFHIFIPLRGNLGAENYRANNDSSDGLPWGTVLWSGDRKNEREYATKGEAGFVHDHGEIAKEWIRTHPKRYWQLNAKRAYMFWFGVPHPTEEKLSGEINEDLRLISFQFLTLCGWFGIALCLKRRILMSGVWLVSFAVFPVTYYLVTVQARFRHPLEPIICVVGVYLFQSAEPGKFGNWIAARFAWLGRLTRPMRPFFLGEA